MVAAGFSLLIFLSSPKLLAGETLLESEAPASRSVHTERAVPAEHSFFGSHKPPDDCFGGTGVPACAAQAKACGYITSAAGGGGATFNSLDVRPPVQGEHKVRPYAPPS